MQEETKTYRRRRSVYTLTFMLLFVVCVGLLGTLGGIGGFVLLVNSNSPAIVNLRHRLGISDKGGLAVPIKQTIQVEESSAIIDAAKTVSPAVVSISISQNLTDFFGNVSNSVVGGGSGFIITSDGLIATNKHVVDTKGATYKVILNDGRIFDATIKAIDSVNDFAVVKIDAKDLPTVDIGSSDGLQIGQYVIAVGNALGEYKNSVTLGVVSGKQRSAQAGSGTSGESLSDLIQTDAAINPGNSGGPLVNLKGQVVGINTLIASQSGGSEGVGFAIAIDSLKNVIDSVRKTGEIVRPFLGVNYQIITKELQQLDSLPVDYGALVTRGDGSNGLAVVPSSPADKAGIQENDIILEVKGERVDDTTPLANRIQKYNVGDTVTLKVLRKGQNIDIKVTLQKAP